MMRLCHMLVLSSLILATQPSNSLYCSILRVSVARFSLKVCLKIPMHSSSDTFRLWLRGEVLMMSRHEHEDGMYLKSSRLKPREGHCIFGIADLACTRFCLGQFHPSITYPGHYQNTPST